eukprot:m.71623 g.71623  ORF g.71623 m.71623 type:complete len:416 (-) comp14195_c0_seq1:21-1268(-)
MGPLWRVAVALLVLLLMVSEGHAVPTRIPRMQDVSRASSHAAQPPPPAADGRMWRWEALPSLPVQWSEGCLVTTANQQIIAIGGYTRVMDAKAAPQVSNETWVFDLRSYDQQQAVTKTAAWARGPALQQRRGSPGCAVLGNTVVVVGGEAGSQDNLDTVELLDASPTNPPSVWSWQYADVKLSPGRSGAAVAPTPDGTAALVVGGFTNSLTYLNDAMLIHADGTTTTPLPEFPVRRASASAVTTSAGVLVFGGGSTLPAYNETVLWSPADSQWHTQPDLLAGGGRNRAGAATLIIPPTTMQGQRGQRIRLGQRGATHDGGPVGRGSTGLDNNEVVLTTGGFSRTPFFDPMLDTECFSVANRTWDQGRQCDNIMLPLPSPRGGIGAAAANSSCMVVAGGEGPGGPSTASAVLRYCL